MTKHHVKVDHLVIAERNPFKVVLPLSSVSIYDSKDRYDREMKPFSTEQRTIFAVLWYVYEVENGGHQRFYSNSTGIVWEDALNGLERVGSIDGKEIMVSSIERFHGVPSFDRTERRLQLESLAIAFDDLDRRLYQLGHDNIMDLLTTYIVNNRAAFYFDGEVDIPD